VSEADGLAEGGRRRLHLLTSRDLEREPADHLPYRWDHLRGHGWDLSWTARHLRPPFTSGPLRRTVGAAERATAPFAQLALGSRSIASSDAVLAMFESEGTVAAVLRSAGLWPFRHVALGVVSCWLAELLPTFSPARRALYRRAYRGVDRLYYFSSNQTEVYEEHLGLDRSVLRPVAFGVDAAGLATVRTEERGYIAAVGRDRGRDWPTLARAVAGTGLQVKLACRESDRAGLELPPEIDYRGFVGPDDYLDLLAGASAVVVPSHVRAYPSGQTVALEAMALGKCVVVTQTPAWFDYLDEQTAITVPPREAEALRDALLCAIGDDQRRRAIGEAARAAATSRFDASKMWATISSDLAAMAADVQG
jgi:glycosyltransferase involved in cell wall biosynthesis